MLFLLEKEGGGGVWAGGLELTVSLLFDDNRGRLWLFLSHNFK